MGEEKDNSIKQVVKYILICFALLAGLYGSTKYFVTHEVFSMFCSHAAERFQRINEKEYVRDLKRQVNDLKQQEIYQTQFKRLEVDTRKKAEIQLEIIDIKSNRRNLEKQIRDLEK